MKVLSIEYFIESYKHWSKEQLEQTLYNMNLQLLREYDHVQQTENEVKALNNLLVEKEKCK